MMTPLLILQCDFENQKHVTLKKIESDEVIRLDRDKDINVNRLKELSKFANHPIDEIFI